MHWSYVDLRDDPARVLRGLAEFFERLPDRTSNVEVLLAKLDRWKLETANVLGLIWEWICDKPESILYFEWLQAEDFPELHPEVPQIGSLGYSLTAIPSHESSRWYVQQFFVCDCFGFPPGFGLIRCDSPSLRQVINHCTNLYQLLNEVADHLQSGKRLPIESLELLSGNRNGAGWQGTGGRIPSAETERKRNAADRLRNPRTIAAARLGHAKRKANPDEKWSLITKRVNAELGTDYSEESIRQRAFDYGVLTDDELPAGKKRQIQDRQEEE